MKILVIVFLLLFIITAANATCKKNMQYSDIAKITKKINQDPNLHRYIKKQPKLIFKCRKG